jgi:hypothetical protein
VFITIWLCRYHGGCLIRIRNCLPSENTWVHPFFSFSFFAGYVLLIILFFVLCFWFCLSLFCVFCLLLPMFLYSWLRSRFFLTFISRSVKTILQTKENDVNEWLLFNAKWEVFQLYHGENKLHYAEMMMISLFVLSQHAKLDFYSTISPSQQFISCTLKAYKLSELNFFILKVANIRCLYWLQLTFFILSYVNSLERRKFVAVLYFWIQ